MGGGMKSGSGDDPFADVETDDDTASSESDEPTTDTAVDVAATTDTETTEIETTATDATSTGLPWKYARESAKSDREMVQFFLQSETQRLEGRAQGDLETILDENVLLLDIREAAYRVALEQHLDDVAAQLREWGYDAD